MACLGPCRTGTLEKAAWGLSLWQVMQVARVGARRPSDLQLRAASSFVRLDMDTVKAAATCRTYVLVGLRLPAPSVLSRLVWHGARAGGAGGAGRVLLCTLHRLRKPWAVRRTSEHAFLLPFDTYFALAGPRWGQQAMTKSPGRSAPDFLGKRGLTRSARSEASRSFQARVWTSE